MMHRGYIKLWRRLQDSEIWLKEKFTRGQAWVDLIGLANHKEGYIRVRGIRIKIKRGQVGWSEIRLAARWQWSRKKVRNFLRELQNIERQIEQQKNNVSSVITILNYELYQSRGTTKGTPEGTTEEQQKNSRVDTNKNDKNSTSTKSHSAGIFEFIDPELLKRIGTKWPKCYQWIQKSLNHKKNKSAIIHVLNRIDGMKSIHDYYAFATKVLNVESGNYNEQEFKVQEAQRQKKELKQHIDSIGEKI